MDPLYFQPESIQLYADRSHLGERLTRVNQALAQKYFGAVLASSKPMQFRESDDLRANAFADVNKDHWDLAEHLRVIQTVSAEFPELVIEVVLEHDEPESITLENGRFGEADVQISQFLESHPRGQRPLYEGLYDHLEALISGAPEGREKGARWIESELARWDWHKENGCPVQLERHADFLSLRCRTNGSVRTIRYCLRILSSPFFVGDEVDFKIRINLSGKSDWSSTMESFAQYFALTSYFQEGARMSEEK